MIARAGHASRRGLGLALSSMLLATPLAAGATEPLAPFEFPRQATVPKPEASAPPAVCGFADLALPADAVVYAAGAYAGRKAGFQIDQSGHEATRIDVAVNSPGRPVALMLGAYEPTVWHIGWSPGTRILAVLVSGYHRQAVAGLPPAVPLLNSSYDNRGPCGYFYVAESRLAELNPMARRVFGLPVGMVFPADKAGRVVVGDAWVDAVMQNAPQPDVPPVAGRGVPRPPGPPMHKAYVVLKPFTLPADLYCAHAVTFIVPRGVPRPQGNPGHSAVYDLNTLTCHGAVCGRP